MQLDKQKNIDVLEKGHKDFQLVLAKLNLEQIEAAKTIGKWSVRDIIAHITAWYWEWIREIDSFLVDRPIMNLTSGDDAFNERQLTARKDKSAEEIREEWGQAFAALITRIKRLNNEEWDHVCRGHFWPDGSEMSMQSLFGTYLDTNLSHEGMHAKEIAEKFNL